jgi:hypothetical protein
MLEKLYELKEKLMKELGEYSQNGKYSKEDVETIKYMASAIDHMCNIIEKAEDEEYSQRGGSYAYDNGNMGGGGYRGNNNYSRGGGSYRGGRGGNSYARGRGQNAPRDSMGRYSRDGDMLDQLEEIKRDAPNDQIRQHIQQLISEIEQM